MRVEVYSTFELFQYCPAASPGVETTYSLLLDTGSTSLVPPTSILSPTISVGRQK